MIENWTGLQNIDGRLSQGNQRKPLEILQAAGIRDGPGTVPSAKIAMS